METAFRKALDRVKASDELKNKTADFIRHIEDRGVSGVSVRAAAKRPIYLKRLVLAACIALVLLALPIGGYAYYMMPTSYLSVDINPSVELGINAFGKVVRVTPYNADGQTILSGLSLLNLDVENAVGRIVKSAAQNGFIKDDGSTLIAVTTETDSPAAAAEIEADAKTAAEAAVTSENDTAIVVTDRIGLDKHSDAAELGISPGKLNLIEKLRTLDPEITLEQYKNATVTDIQKKFVELKKEQKVKDIDAVPQVSPSHGADVSPSATAAATPSPSLGAPSDNGKNPKQHPNNGNGNSDNPNGGKDNDSGKKDGDANNNAGKQNSHDGGAGGSPASQPPKEHENGNSHGNGSGSNGHGNSGKK